MALAHIRPSPGQLPQPWRRQGAEWCGMEEELWFVLKSVSNFVFASAARKRVHAAGAHNRCQESEPPLLHASVSPSL